MIVLVDNYDSFTFNLEHVLRCAGEQVRTVRCDAVTVADVLSGSPRGIVLSPGPGCPGERGIGVELVREAMGRIPILGVCLGHQELVVALGGRVVPARDLVHGKTSPMSHDGRGVFQGLASPMNVMRYHSLVVDETSLPDELEACAWLDDGTIMAVRHRCLQLAGVQFHPESFLTPDGPSCVRRFLEHSEVVV